MAHFQVLVFIINATNPTSIHKLTIQYKTTAPSTLHASLIFLPPPTWADLNPIFIPLLAFTQLLHLPVFLKNILLFITLWKGFPPICNLWRLCHLTAYYQDSSILFQVDSLFRLLQNIPAREDIQLTHGLPSPTAILAVCRFLLILRSVLWNFLCTPPVTNVREYLTHTLWNETAAPQRDECWNLEEAKWVCQVDCSELPLHQQGRGPPSSRAAS